MFTGILAFALVQSAAAADVQLTHQGRLLDNLGQAVNGSHLLTIVLYDDATATGAPHELHTESFTGVDTDSGYFSVTVGSTTTLDSSVFGRPNIWVGVQVDGAPELGARMLLGQTPTAAWSRGVTLPTVAAGCGSAAAPTGSLRWSGSAVEVCDQNDVWSSISSSGGSPVGTVVASMLTPAQFASTPGGGDWVLADGQSVSGTAYATLTGNTTAPDLRGMFLRGRNEGRADGQQNPDGELALGSYQADQFDSHVHNISGFGTVQLHNAGSQSGTYIQSGSRNTAASGGNETRSRNVTVNYFLRIN